jgi:hypothetical protein
MDVVDQYTTVYAIKLNFEPPSSSSFIFLPPQLQTQTPEKEKRRKGKGKKKICPYNFSVTYL